MLSAVQAINCNATVPVAGWQPVAVDPVSHGSQTGLPAHAGRHLTG